MTIQQIFNNFEVDGVSIPVELLKHDGDKVPYITYQEINNEPMLNADNEVIASVISYDFDIYSKGNFKKIVKAVKQLLKENNYMWNGDSADFYEEDTKLYHKTLTFQIENMED